MNLALIRYPGTKARLAKRLHDFFPALVEHYTEPFVGSGAMALATIERFVPKITILNDADPGIAAMWTAVKDHPEDLIGMVRQYKPSVEGFFRWRDEPVPNDPVHLGFRKIVLHQCSFSGIGSSPIGGRDQTGKWDVGCRWHADLLCEKIGHANALLNRSAVTITNQDFEHVLDNTPRKSFVYLDPPYYVQGKGLYAHSFEREDHRRLAGVLERSAFSWLMSYDNAPEIVAMYKSFAKVGTIDTKYCIRSDKSKGKKTSELVISSAA